MSSRAARQSGDDGRSGASAPTRPCIPRSKPTSCSNTHVWATGRSDGRPHAGSLKRAIGRLRDGPTVGRCVVPWLNRSLVKTVGRTVRRTVGALGRTLGRSYVPESALQGPDGGCGAALSRGGGGGRGNSPVSRHTSGDRVVEHLSNVAPNRDHSKAAREREVSGAEAAYHRHVGGGAGPNMSTPTNSFPPC